ncbi:alpha/beta fold hydrolase [Salinispora tropica]|uniref:Alpha/beta hydrolase fold n=1 Tax=Salinispora tropica (strain ATCC BAA-916 / DSM 44818 / JCM 13857 / NBRC 105044 / CNB-440) TaxID=369723 RepID=A4X3P3_SALTO|nr:alpha/beta hydrolase [Salinispora tropica]ABP53493.1 alpha/beta hydrolase fold [Salinispora tropica CNB-440]
MPFAFANDIRLHYELHGTGDPVVLVSGAGVSGKSWLIHQGPALLENGYRVCVYDSRGQPPSDECVSGFVVEDLVADLAALLEFLDAGPARLIGTSTGAYVVQELALRRPELVRQAVLMASRARPDVLRTQLARAEIELGESGVTLPSSYRAVVRALQMLSPRSMDDESSIRDWLALLELAPPDGAGVRHQLALQPMPDRRAAYAEIAVPCHVVSFADDLIAPPGYGEELAGCIPGATFDLVGDAGHFGYLERPEEVNHIIAKHFAGIGARLTGHNPDTRRSAPWAS